MRVVVAGGRGFIGSHIVRAVNAGDNVAVAAGTGEVIEQIQRETTDAIVWAAGTRSADRDLLREQHLDSAMAALAAASQLRRFVYLSTGEVYGAGRVPFEESTELAPAHPYAVMKSEAEIALAEAASRRGVALVILRLSLVYGPGQSGSMFIPDLIEHLRADKAIALTPGRQTRDFVFVGDVTHAVALALQPSMPALTYNIGSGIESPLREVAAAVVASLGADESLLHWGALPYRPREIMRYVFDISRAQSELGYAPSHSIRQGIRKTVQGRSTGSELEDSVSSH